MNHTPLPAFTNRRHLLGAPCLARAFTSGVAAFAFLALFTSPVSAITSTTLVSNLGNSSDNFRRVTFIDKFFADTVGIAANPFTTGSSAALLHSVTLSMDSQGVVNGGGFAVSLHMSGASGPGTLISTLTGQTNPATAGTYTYTASTPLSLAAATTYYIVASVPQAAPDKSYGWKTTTVTAETGTAGWSIGNNSWTSENGGSSWVQAGSGTFITQFSVNGSLVTPTLPPTVTTATQSGIGENGATLGGEVTADGGASVSDRGIVWATTPTPTTANNKVQIGSGTGTFSTAVTGFPVNTQIYVRAYATNTGGTAYGSEISFNTLADMTAPTVVSVRRQTPGLQAISTTSVTFRVTYSEAVTGVAVGRFQVVPVNGSSITGTATGVTPVSQSVYDVAVTVTGGAGEFRLRVID